MLGLPTEAIEEREVLAHRDDQNDKTCIPKDDDEVSISSISEWSAFNPNGESLVDGDTPPVHHPSDPNNLDNMTNADQVSAGATTIRSEEAASGGGLSPKSGQAPPKHRRSTESYLPSVLKPYSTTISELDRARGQCESEMMKILREASKPHSLARTMRTDSRFSD